jgi:hypothetical protein
MKKLLVLILCCAFLSSVAPVWADEGMWTFDNPPLKDWKERYNFEPSAKWLEHVRLASVRLNDGGSGSFVSPNGLLMTNQHVASGQLQKVSTPERDYIKEGFYAATQAEELKCPDLEINVLVSYQDVTKQVQDAVRAGASGKEAVEQRKARIAEIEKQSTQETGLKSEVVKLYNGGEYWVYRYKKYTDIRLVFAPEEQIAFFGGDYDNFTYPRYNLDVAFFRVYENGVPARTPDYFKWSANGPADGEFVLIAGNPGSTSRLLTVAQLHYQRDLGNPLQMQVWTTRRDALVRYAATSPEAARQASTQRRGLENSIKRLVGQQSGLTGSALLARKEEEEKKLRAAVAAKPDLQQRYGSAWNEIETAYKALPAMAKRIAFTSLSASRLGSLATNVVLYAEETQKPNDRRYDEFRDTNLESLRFNLLSPAPIYPAMETALLAAWLDEAQKTLGANDPFVRAALGGSSATDVAKRVIEGTKLADVAFRKSLLDGGPAAVSSSTDPLIELARKIVPIMRELREWQETSIQSVEAAAGQKIAEARFAVYGKSVYPDATFTPRLGYGQALGYEEDTTLVPFKTTFYGLYDRAESFGEKPPFNLPRRYKENKSQIELSTPFNFVYTADTIGGNSGSPVINRNAEIVGLNFDSNIQKLPNRYAYIEANEGGRAVAVHSVAIIEMLKQLYKTQALVDEILGARE